MARRKRKTHGTNDIVQKKLLWDNYVFADVFNTLLFNGEDVIKAKDLEPADIFSFYGVRTRSQIFEQQRDVAKQIRDPERGGLVVGCLCIENQSSPAINMPMRVIGYDAASYSQWLHDIKSKHATHMSRTFYSTVTLVLNYSKNRWNKTPRSLMEMLKREANSYGNFTSLEKNLLQHTVDYKMHVFDISWLSEEQVLKFKSKFRYVADFFVGQRTGHFQLMQEALKSEDVAEIASFINAVSGQDFYDKALIKELEKDKDKVVTMEQVIHPYVNLKKAEERLRAMNNVMTETNCSEEQALKILHYTQEEIEEYKTLVGQTKKIS